MMDESTRIWEMKGMFRKKNKNSFVRRAGGAAIVAALLLALLCGCGAKSGGGAVSPGAGSGGSSVPGAETGAKTGSGAVGGEAGSGGSVTITGVDTNQNWDAVYAPILQGYRDAIMNGFKDYPNKEYNSDDLVPYGVREYYGLGNRVVLYAHKDIDGNNVPELIICCVDFEALITVEDIWTIANTGPVRVFGNVGDGYFTGFTNDSFQWVNFSENDGYVLAWFLGIGSSGGAVVNAVGRKNSAGDYEYYEPPSPHPLWTEVLAETHDAAYNNIAVSRNQISGDEITNLHLKETPNIDFSWSPLFTQSNQRNAKDLTISSDGVIQPDDKIDKANESYPARVVPKDGVNLRKGPAADYDVIAAIPYNKEVEEIGFNRDNYDWVYVRYNDHEGWVASKYVEYSGMG